MFIATPSVLDRLIRDRQDDLLLSAPVARAAADRKHNLRVRIGHALVGIGAALSGECVELRPRRVSPSRAA